MKVTYLINALGEGGTERSLADLLPGLRNAGVEASILTLRSRGSEGVEPLLREQGFDISVVGGGGRLATLRSIRRHLRNSGCQVLHTMLFEANLYGRLAAIGTPASTLVSLVNTTYSEERLSDPRLNRRKVRAVQAFDVLLARTVTDHFHAVSAAVRDDALAGLRLHRSQVTVIERGRRAETLPVATLERRSVVRAELGIAEDAHVLVAVGRQEYQKGYRYLVEAMAQLDGRSDIVVIAAGREGNESAELSRLVTELPAGCPEVRFIGHRGDVPAVLAAGDVFVFPSLFEGMPGAVIEAMAVGLPIVASDIAPVRDVVEPDLNAVLVPPRNPGGLASAVAELLDAGGRRHAMGLQSRLLFDRRFTMERSVDEFRQLYERLAGRTQ